MEDSAARRGRWCDDAEGNVATLEAARVGMADLWDCEGWRGRGVLRAGPENGNGTAGARNYTRVTKD
ncbi:hypothetical protein SAY86_010878 [Trapa natans]|uniref:Uncharacterized protein n=1 Tax=Trapa natans TaxID=22666 RepID=A0AAN7LSZ3_TRANT|nr:hypothetical protein SAY86_010878 [Trapa natans]